MFLPLSLLWNMERLHAIFGASSLPPLFWRGGHPVSSLDPDSCVCLLPLLQTHGKKKGKTAQAVTALPRGQKQCVAKGLNALSSVLTCLRRADPATLGAGSSSTASATPAGRTYVPYRDSKMTHVLKEWLVLLQSLQVVWLSLSPELCYPCFLFLFFIFGIPWSSTFMVVFLLQLWHFLFLLGFCMVL